MNHAGTIIDLNLNPEMDAKERSKLVRIPDDQFEDVTKMNRAQRRKWYREQRRAAKREASAPA